MNKFMDGFKNNFKKWFRIRKKAKKGRPGYLDYKLQVEILRTVAYFVIVAALFWLGYSQTHSNKNLLTVVAVVGCLPASKALVGVITRLPYRSMDKKTAREIRDKSVNLTMAYDLVLTSKEKIMPVGSIAILGNKVFGYAPSDKVDVDYAARFVRQMLSENELGKVDVRLVHQYGGFLSKLEAMDKSAEGKERQRERERQIANVIMNISL